MRKRKVHTYTRNDRRQLEADQITTLAGVDGTVQSITRKYDTLGRLTHVTSHGNSTNDPSNSTNVRNQIEYTHNSFGKVEHSYQSHSGEATTSSPATKYVYDEGKTGSVYDDALRIQLIEYPLVPDDTGTGTPAQLWYTYFATGSLPDRLHRPGYQRILSGDWLSGNEAIISYPKYNSLSRVVEVSHWRDESPDVLISRFRSFAFGSNDYAAFDRFGRSLEKKWTNSTSVLSQVDYTYDHASNRLTRSVTGASSLDQTYTYDDLHRLKTNDETGTSNDRYWEYDQLGNWSKLRNGLTDTSTVVEARTHNDVNEIATFLNGVGIAHDAAGNTIEMPGAVVANMSLKYDAWNRLIKVQDSDEDDENVDVNEYDGLNRRIVRRTYDPVTAQLLEKRHFYYNENWQVLVESVEVAAVETPDCMYSYLPNYVDAVAVRMRANDAHIYLQDANFNVTAITDDTGSVVERYAYSPYGEVTVLDPNFSPVTGNTSTIDNEYLYTGRRLDPGTGLQYSRYRFYASHLGRWVNRDPIGYWGGDANLYGYVGGRPLYYVDPWGLEQCGFSVWVYTGDWCVADNVYAAATGAAGDYYLENAGDAHQALQNIAVTDPTGLANATDALLTAVEGEDLHEAVMGNAQLRPPGQQNNQNAADAVANALPPPLRPNPPPPGPPGQNGGQQAIQCINDWGPGIIAGAGLVSSLFPSPEETQSLQHGTTLDNANNLLTEPPRPGVDDGGFWMNDLNGPFPLGSAEAYAEAQVNQAILNGDPFGGGGPAILQVEVPASIIDLGQNQAGAIGFLPDEGFQELIDAWPGLDKQIIIPGP